MDRGPDGSAGLDAARCWELTRDAIRAVATSDAHIVGIGVAAQLGLVVVDLGLRAITPVMLWSDQTAKAYVPGVRAALAAPGAPVVGRMVTAELAAPRLRMLLDRQPRIMERAAKVLSLKDYLTAQLTGTATTDPTHASYTLLYDVVSRSWSVPFAGALGISADLLPPVRGASEIAGQLRADVARDCGLPEGIAVAVGGPDGTVGAIGAGAIASGRTVDIAGTTDVLVHVVDSPLVDPAMVITTNAHVPDGLWTIGGATGMTGGMLDWVAHTLGYADVESLHSSLDPSLFAEPIGSNGVLMDPALTGHRFPYWNLDRVGSIHGLTPGTLPTDLVSAAHEGAAFVVGDGLRELARLGQRVTAVMIVGGVARRHASLQLRANVWGVPVEGVSDGMATSRGVAILAATASGLFSGLAEATAQLAKKGVIFDPIAEQADAYSDTYARWRSTFSRPSQGIDSDR